MTAVRDIAHVSGDVTHLLDIPADPLAADNRRPAVHALWATLRHRAIKAGKRADKDGVKGYSLEASLQREIVLLWPQLDAADVNRFSGHVRANLIDTGHMRCIRAQHGPGKKSLWWVCDDLRHPGVRPTRTKRRSRSQGADAVVTFAAPPKPRTAELSEAEPSKDSSAEAPAISSPRVELEVMDIFVTFIEKLDLGARRRVATWVYDRYRDSTP
jgi:hypothetical protein